MEAERGDTAAELLGIVHHAPDALMGQLRQRVEAAGLSGANATAALDTFEAALGGYTYLHHE